MTRPRQMKHSRERSSEPPFRLAVYPGPVQRLCTPCIGTKASWKPWKVILPASSLMPSSSTPDSGPPCQGLWMWRVWQQRDIVPCTPKMASCFSKRPPHQSTKVQLMMQPSLVLYNSMAGAFLTRAASPGCCRV